MRNWFVKALIVCALVCLGAGSALAGGFALYEYSARGNATGNAFMAAPGDASAVALNPASITEFASPKTMVGISYLTPDAQASMLSAYDSQTRYGKLKTNWFVDPHFFVTTPVNEVVHLGLGAFSRYGLGSQWDDDWAGRYNSTYAVVETYSVNPNLAIRLGDMMSIAVGIEFMWMDLDLRQKIDATKIFAATGQTAALAAKGLPTTINDPSTSYLDVSQRIAGDSMGYGGNLALNLRPFKWMDLGVMYRSPVHQRVEGTAEFRKSQLVNALLPTLFNNTNAQGTVTLPEQVHLGVKFTPCERLNFGISAVYTGWSSYRDLTIHYDQAAVGTNSATSVKNWEDVWRLQFGVEVWPLEWLALRAGYTYDQTPIPDDHADYLVPSADYNIFGGGIGLKFGPNASLDLSYTWLISEKRDIASRQTADGVLESTISDSEAHILGVSFSYQF